MKVTLNLIENTAQNARGLRNLPLQASVQGGILIIAIGVETLAWAADAQNGGPFEETKVVDADIFAVDVCAQIMNEGQGYNNEPEVGRFLDQRMVAACEHGSAGLK